MISAADIDVLVFDVLGTVVDEAGSMRAELAAALDEAGRDPREAAAVADRWAHGFDALLFEVRQGAPWRSTDDLNAAALAAALENGPSLPKEAVARLALAGHRLRPWPDSRDALRRLAERFTVVALSNGNLSMLTDLFAAGGLTWHGVLSGEMVQAYKPDPVVYQLAVEGLDLNPQRTLMVAAHPWDLRAAAAHGLRTAYIERAGEGTPGPADTFDLSAPDLAGLAARLLAAGS
jgi:2-haloacid dehalogenase